MVRRDWWEWKELFWDLYYEARDKGMDDEEAREYAADEVYFQRYGPNGYYGVSLMD